MVGGRDVSGKNTWTWGPLTTRIAKENRETDEETKQILRMLEKDDVGTSGLGEGASFVMKSTSREPGWGKLMS